MSERGKKARKNEKNKKIPDFFQKISNYFNFRLVLWVKGNEKAQKSNREKEKTKWISTQSSAQ